MLKSGKVEAPTVVLTFDDGYRENYLNSQAVSTEEDFSAAFFVCTKKIGTDQGFTHDTKRGEEGFLPLTWEQVRSLHESGFELGSHTRTHFDCGSTDLERLKDEILGSKSDLESEFEKPIKYFSFPWGKPENISEASVGLAENAYMALFAADGGVNLPGSHSPRIFNRIGHCNDLWELELNLQSVLEFKRRPS
jgi:peptidoglycan/xylan/chitin deacetylase (PgdA/CDA1 family)